MTNTRWIIPEAKEPVAQGSRDASAAGSVASGKQLRIGLLDNTKDNAHMLLQLIGERVRQEFNAEILYRRKGNATTQLRDVDAYRHALCRERPFCVDTAAVRRAVGRERALADAHVSDGELPGRTDVEQPVPICGRDRFIPGDHRPRGTHAVEGDVLEDVEITGGCGVFVRS